MRPTITSSLAAIAIVLAAARVASADERVAFETVFSSDHAGPDRAERRVIRSRAELEAFFGRAAPDVAVDFERETLIGVALGRRARATATIEVQRVTEKAAAGTRVAFVDVVERRGGAGEPASTWETSPVHLVKLKKGATRFFFRDAAAAGPAFDTLRLTVRPSSGYLWTYVLELDRHGVANVSRELDKPERQRSTATGRATAGELRAIEAAFAKADLATIPSPFTPSDGLPSGTAVVLAATSSSGTITRAGQHGSYGDHGARLRGLIDVLESLAKRLADQGSAVVRDVTGTLSVSGGAAVIVESRSSALEVTNEPFRSLLRALPQDAIVVATARVFRTHAFGGTAEVINLQAQLPSGAKLREAPKADARVTGDLAANALVKVIGKEGSWLCVLAEGRAGWIQKDTARVAILPPGADTKGVAGSVPR